MNGRRLSPAMGVGLLVDVLMLASNSVQSFVTAPRRHAEKPRLPRHPAPSSSSSSSLRRGEPTVLCAKSKTKKKKSARAKSASGGLKGFGSSSPTGKSAASSAGTIDRSPSALKFYDYLRRNGGESNLKRVGLGYFPLRIGPGDDDIIRLRGVIALRDIPKGEPIIEIPYEMALDLGRESADPTLPATTLLQKYCAWTSGADGPASDKERADYFAMLPPYLSDDCLGSTDFFSDGALDMLQSPMIAEDTRSRRELVRARYERDVGPMAEISPNLYRWSDDGGAEGAATRSHLQWASWIVTSRVLTVQGPPESSAANRLLIPLIDMCNHDRDSPHVLTGRAVRGGTLKVVAGADVATGDAVDIGYGGSVEGNDRFVQDYGFLDAGGSRERAKRGDDGSAFVAEAYKIVARKLLGKGRSVARMTAAEQRRELDALGATSLEDDEALLSSGKVANGDERVALDYRMGMKRALRELN